MEPSLKSYFRALTIAGSDSGGGAGIQADLKTFCATGTYGMSVITALTAQNTLGVRGIHAVPPDFVKDQLEAVLTDIGTDAVKVGMLFSAELIHLVARELTKHRVRNIVIDPVMVAQSGDKLLQDDAIDAVSEYLLPIADVATPNFPEAEVLLGRRLRDEDAVRKGAVELSKTGSRSILIKGGHADASDITDVLYLREEDRFIVMKQRRVKTRNNHGTGCTLSSAVASYLAQKNDIEHAVRKAKAYIGEAIMAGARYEIGHGNGPVHHLFKYWG